MKNSALLRWTNNKNSKNQQNGKNWLHSSESLQKGHIAYLVKFLGSTPVDCPKGMEVVKEASRKLQFNQQIRKSEGVRIPKVELTISVNGVAIKEPKTKHNLHQYPLHRISFCADDKAEKRFFSFIAKESDNESHTCFVFVSDKLSEEITLTIGQAFDLAYRRFLETTGKELELRRQVANLQSKLKEAEEENSRLRQQLEGSVNANNILLDDFENGLGSESSTDVFSDRQTPSNLGSLPPLPPRNSKIDDLLSDSAPESDDSDFNPRALDGDMSDTSKDIFATQPTVASDRGFMDDDFNPRAEESPVIESQPKGHPVISPPPLIPPPRPSRPHEVANQTVDDLFSSNGNDDPFAANNGNNNNNNKNDDILAQFIEMKNGFSQGLTLETGNQDFNLDSLDPLKK